jgi:hypothetical protein
LAGAGVFCAKPTNDASSHTIVKRSGWAYGSGRSNTASTKLKIAVFAPMPSASTATAMEKKPGLCRICRQVDRK